MNAARNTRFKELEAVVLTHDVTEHSLRKGDVGTVVHVYEIGDAIDVEFLTAEGKTVAVLTLLAGDIRSLEKNEILHARGFAVN